VNLPGPRGGLERRVRCGESPAPAETCDRGLRSRGSGSELARQGRRRSCSPQLAGGAIGANPRRFALSLKGQNVIRLRACRRKAAIEDQRPLESPKLGSFGSFDDRNAKPVDCRGEEGGGAKNHADHSSRREDRRLDAPHRLKLSTGHRRRRGRSAARTDFFAYTYCGPQTGSPDGKRPTALATLIPPQRRLADGDDHGPRPDRKSARRSKFQVKLVGEGRAERLANPTSTLRLGGSFVLAFRGPATRPRAAATLFPAIATIITSRNTSALSKIAAAHSKMRKICENLLANMVNFYYNAHVNDLPLYGKKLSFWCRRQSVSRVRVMREALLTLLVEPDALFREGLNRILRAGRFRMLRSAAALDDTINDVLATPHTRSLLVVGPGNDADAAARQIGLFKEKRESGRVAVIADNYRPKDVLSAFRAGANAYFVKVTNCEAFVKSLELVVLGETFMPAQILPLLLDREVEAVSPLEKAVAPPAPKSENAGAPHLSQQEKRILRYLVEGNSNKVIARKIDIAEATVKVHIKAILRKVRVHNRTQAAIWAMHNSSLELVARDGLDKTLLTAELQAH
jgi:two-component system, NarL family, nitrate/nitrite response regulator NarL